jgi:hypothetical protein
MRDPAPPASHEADASTPAQGKETLYESSQLDFFSSLLEKLRRKA